MAEILTPQQQMAVNNRGGKLLVSAAAGSGKTKVLIDRLLSYILDSRNPANLDDFLIITYTKAAASELRGKIAAKLTQLIAAEPQNRHLRRQLQRLYLTKISTVHSFCADILREYAYCLDVSADFRVADETECAELQMQVLEEVLENAYENVSEDPDFCAFIDTQGVGRDDRQIPQIILKVYSSARCHLNPDQWLQWCVDSTQTEALTDAGKTVWGEYLISDLHNALDLHIDALQKCSSIMMKTGGMPKPLAVLDSTIVQLVRLRSAKTWDEIVSHRNIDYGRLVFPKNCTDQELVERIKSVRNACKKSLEKKLGCFSDTSAQIFQDLNASSGAVRGLITLVKRFSQEYDKRKKVRRVLDFGDLEHKMLDLLLGKKRTGPTAVSAEIGARYREIMVDEYQDSNGVQDAIFEALTKAGHNCFLVGDVKQSIYQFRLADPEIFIEKYNAYLPAENAQEKQGRKVLLSSNFRSSGGIISAVNDVFSYCMSEKVGGLHYGQEEMLREGIPHIPLGDMEVELYGIDIHEDTYAEEASFVADRISELLDGCHMIRQDGELRPVRAEDIVILLRSPGSVGGEFVFALEQRGLPCVTGASVDLLQTEEVSTVRSILQVISNPLQDIPLIAVLGSRVFGFTADELADIRGENKYCNMYDALLLCGKEKACRFANTLNQLRHDARLCSVPELLQKVFTRTKLDSIFSSLPDGENRTNNLQVFCQLATAYESNGRMDLDQFLDHLDAIEEKGLVQNSEQKPSGAVTIMSIHKSKGLEFPVVFLCGLSRSFNQESSRAQILCHKELGLGLNCFDARSRIRYPTIAKRAIAVKMMAESISEELRVLYVAMTRPRDRLIMTYAAKNLQSDLQDIAQRLDMCNPLLLTSEVDCPGSWVLQSAMQRTEAGAFFALAGHPDCVVSHDTVWSIRTVEAKPYAQARNTFDTATEVLDPATVDSLRKSLAFCYPHFEATVTPSKQTATQLKGRAKDQEAAENTCQLHRHSFRRPTFIQQGITGKEYGNAIHAVMQYICYEACTDKKGIEAEIQRLVSEQYISAEHGQLADAEKIMKLFSTPIGRKLRSGIMVLREFKFSILDDASKYASALTGEKVLLQGVVDCALLEPEGITIIDFKTDYVTEETLPEKITQYNPQVSVYADALERIYGKRVKSTQLYFFCLDRFVELNL